MEDTEFYTATMAKVYADQGHAEKALEIYRYILEQDPDRSDILDARAKLEAKLLRETPASEKRLLGMFHKWIALMLIDVRLASLKKLKNIQNS